MQSLSPEGTQYVLESHGSNTAGMVAGFIGQGCVLLRHAGRAGEVSAQAVSSVLSKLNYEDRKSPPETVRLTIMEREAILRTLRAVIDDFDQAGRDQHSAARIELLNKLLGNFGV
jgi:hypothetical protein